MTGLLGLHGVKFLQDLAQNRDLGHPGSVHWCCKRIFYRDFCFCPKIVKVTLALYMNELWCGGDKGVSQSEKMFCIYEVFMVSTRTAFLGAFIMACLVLSGFNLIETLRFYGFLDTSVYETSSLVRVIVGQSKELLVTS